MPTRAQSGAATSAEASPATRRPPTPEGPAPLFDPELLLVIPPILGIGLGMALLLLLAIGVAVQPNGLLILGNALFGEQSAWYLTRASAFAAYGLLWLSMVWGLTLTNRMARVWPGGPTAADLHEHASLLGLGFVVLHAVSLLGDHFIGYSLADILIPFAGGAYRPLWVGLGQLGLYLMLPVTFTFYVRRWIGAKAWRAIHLASFAVFALALLHGVFSGTDSGAAWAFWMYVGTGLSVLGLTLYRLGARRA